LRIEIAADRRQGEVDDGESTNASAEPSTEVNSTQRPAGLA
jgi:hypothetical protein